MIKLFLCDDNRLHLEHTAKYISSLPRSSAFEVQTFSAPQELLAKIREGDVPNIAILDVEMPKIEGIPLAEQINRLCPQCKIIFLTGFTRYAYDAYYAEHIWYILKTDMEKYLPAALEKAASALDLPHPEPFIVIQQQRTLRRLPLKDILYLERVTYRTRIKTVDSELFVRAAPGELISELPHGSFIRSHQSFWVNSAKINSLIGKNFLLVDGSAVPISRTYRSSAAREFVEARAATIDTFSKI